MIEPTSFPVPETVVNVTPLYVSAPAMERAPVNATDLSLANVATRAGVVPAAATAV